MSVVTVTGKIRAKSANAVIVIGKTRATNCLVMIVGKTRARAANTVTVTGKVKSRALSMEALQSMLQPLSITGDDDSLYFSPTFSIKFATKLILIETGHGSTDFTEFLGAFNLTRRKNEMSSWSFTLQDNMDRDLSPKNTASPYYQKLFIDFYDDNFVLEKYLVFYILHGDYIWQSSDLIVTNYSYNSRTRQLSLSGTDMTRHLYIPNQNMDPWEDSDAHTICKAILDEFGIHKYVITFKNYDIKSFEFVGQTPIDRINEILFVGMATWFFKDNTFYAVSDVDQSKFKTWLFKDRDNIYDLIYSQSLEEYYNEITIGRTEKITNVCEYEGKEFGFHMESLCAQLVSPNVSVVDADGGDVVLIFTGNDGGCAQHDDFPAGDNVCDDYAGPATWLSFVFKQKEGIVNSGISDFSVGYKLRVTGHNAEDYANYGSYDPNFSYTYKKQEEQKKFGVWKYPSSVENPLIPDSEWAEDLAKWILKEHSRSKEKVNLVSAINSEMYPCDTLKITDYGTGLSTESYCVEEVAISGSLSESVTNINASKYEGTIGSVYM